MLVNDLRFPEGQLQSGGKIEDRLWVRKLALDVNQMHQLEIATRLVSETGQAAALSKCSSKSLYFHMLGLPTSNEDSRILSRKLSTFYRSIPGSLHNLEAECALPCFGYSDTSVRASEFLEIIRLNAVSFLLNAQWVGGAWELLSNELKESIVRSFRKCGITIALDGSEDYDINIRGLESYTVGIQISESEDTIPDSDDEYEPESNSGEEDAGAKKFKHNG
ncbi:hypothetical protein L211DRAFT_849180 [Terfezia boudieri ATCC MYA-4762]|uniref:Uncharacterized protein n=1 Tax=Terfezia boudieri ATCC MYA-4762 TaxID=1051890 RepID=A0A3N4LMA9_9PEZI|nr:hypothetical protein L211DRAFT_849180 [Terfezia boudieri ATCC MYA-4762]